MSTHRSRAKPAVKADGRRGESPGGVVPGESECSGSVDVGVGSHFLAVPEGRSQQPVREFASFTADLYRMADWLAECGVETVAMESTRVFWIPLFGV